jgi:hypothetical protein
VSRERTPCPHCGRDTQTTSDGACVECWGRKRDGPPRLFSTSPRRERGSFWGELDDWVAGLMGVDSGAILVIGALVVALGVVLLKLLG